ncbi:MAG: hypothetical protein HZB53_05150 [Chloroflexi bacterium]|nr:hypothetical protein [Chloroflexota bacterium]
MSKRTVLAWLALAALFVMACDISFGNVPQAKTGPTVTYPISAAAPAGSPVDLVITMGGGSLDVTGGATALVEGSVQTNVAEWKPTVTTTSGMVIVAQGISKSPITDSTDTVNKWTLKLGKTPMRLKIGAGATTGKLELGGVPLQSLRVEQGASATEIRWSSANPEVLKDLTVNAGAASITLAGLASANLESLTFSGGASNYTLDFSGKLQRSATATVKAGVSNITLIVPEGIPAKATLSGGLRAANAEGAWQKSGDTYTLAGSGPTLTINVEMGLGALFLKNK